MSPTDAANTSAIVQGTKFTQLYKIIQKSNPSEITSTFSQYSILFSSFQSQLFYLLILPVSQLGIKYGIKHIIFNNLKHPYHYVALHMLLSNLTKTSFISAHFSKICFKTTEGLLCLPHTEALQLYPM